MKRRIALAGALALVFSVFSAPSAMADRPSPPPPPPEPATCGTVTGHTLTISEAGAYALTLQMNGDVLVADHATGGVCQDAPFDVSTLTLDVVQITNGASVTYILDDVTTERVGDWAGLTFDVMVTAGDGRFDASGVRDYVGVDVHIDYGGDFLIRHGDGDLDVAGHIVFVGSEERDTFDARTYERYVVADGGYDNDVIYGGNGDDQLTCSSSGYDQCWGTDGDDDIWVGRGDTVAPGDGRDEVTAYGMYGDWTLTYVDSSYGITYDKEGYGYVRSSGGDDRIYGDAPLTVIGSRYADQIIGDDEDETLIGGDGADLIRGHEGDDRISGEAGDDTLYGGRDSDTISGGDGDDELFGRRGSDMLRGDDGRDRLNGGRDRDACSGEYETACEM